MPFKIQKYTWLIACSGLKNVKPSSEIGIHLIHLHDEPTRVPDLAEKTTPYETIIVSTMMRSMRCFPRELVQQYLQNIEHSVEESIRQFATLGTPTVIWMRGTSIRWVNQAYRDLTGFNIVFGKDEDVSVFEEMSDEGLRQALLAGFNTFLTEVPFYNFNGGLRNHKDVGPRFIPGTFSVNYKVDDHNFVLFFIGVFLPSYIEPLTTKSLDWDGLQNQIEKKCSHIEQVFGDQAALIKK
eukprot:TRINITY_DN10584_c0_g1_i1.p1 TRINITY_DN10584_c0_g1~~TRINITY_DN10584_c0_g1_i1.p1  ORF type:complete len:239 (-),score=39.51 TRINITY_DN10584_c0_g1_i1:21-737(-)